MRGTSDGPKAGRQLRSGDEEIITQQVAGVEPAIDSHRPAQQTGTARPLGQVLDGFEGAQQHRGTVPSGSVTTFMQ
jgi:hypothetical protein